MKKCTSARKVGSEKWTVRKCSAGGGLVNMGGDNQVQIWPYRNAVLAAAAPQMLEALSKAQDELDAIGDILDGDGDAIATIIAARAVRYEASKIVDSALSAAKGGE